MNHLESRQGPLLLENFLCLYNLALDPQLSQEDLSSENLATHATPALPAAFPAAAWSAKTPVLMLVAEGTTSHFQKAVLVSKPWGKNHILRWFGWWVWGVELQRMCLEPYYKK